MGEITLLQIYEYYNQQKYLEGTGPFIGDSMKMSQCRVNLWGALYQLYRDGWDPDQQVFKQKITVGSEAAYLKGEGEIPRVNTREWDLSLLNKYSHLLVNVSNPEHMSEMTLIWEQFLEYEATLERLNALFVKFTKSPDALSQFPPDSFWKPRVEVTNCKEALKDMLKNYEGVQGFFVRAKECQMQDNDQIAREIAAKADKSDEAGCKKLLRMVESGVLTDVVDNQTSTIEVQDGAVFPDTTAKPAKVKYDMPHLGWNNVHGRDPRCQMEMDSGFHASLGRNS